MEPEIRLLLGWGDCVNAIELKPRGCDIQAV
jgi:hypothetical protein